MDGVLNIHKHPGPTSHDIVYQVRRLYGQKRVGHAGTLDPMATGVLVVCLGKATRIVEYLMGSTKEYRARLILGKSTDTQDSTGELLEERDASGVTREALYEAVASFVGHIQQTPPMVSALRHQGKRLYEIAREGKTVERAARPIHVHSIDITSFTPGHFAEAEIVVQCASGTYIRTLCADIGAKLDVGGLMAMLERTQVGSFRIELSVTLDELAAAESADDLAAHVVSLSDALADMPTVVITDEEVISAGRGMAIAIRNGASVDQTVRILSESGLLVGVGLISERNGEIVVLPKKVLMEVNEAS